jgi:CRISPR-associated protein Cas2
MVLIAYDIADPKRLRRVARLLQNYGLRAQNSTFELDIGSKDLTKIERSIAEMIDHQEDKVFFYRISDKKKKSKRRGKRKNMWELIF